MSDKKIDNTSNSYGDDAIVTLSPREHIRLRPGMYIGKLGVLSTLGFFHGVP